MSSAILGFTDDMLVSDTVLKDPGLMDKLGRAMRDIVTVAKEAEEANIESPVRSSDEGQKPLALEKEVVEVGEAGRPQDCSSGPIPFSTNNELVTSSDSLDRLLGYVAPESFSKQDNPKLSFESNIFGNGWGDRVATAFLDLPTGPQPGFDDFPLGFKIIHSTLQLAYHALFGSPNMPPGAARRLFGYSLRYHPRDEILFNIRWFLGPGYLEMYRLGNISYGGGNFAHVFKAAAREHIGELNLAVDADALQNEGVGDPQNSPFMNANAVEGYLRSRGIRYINADVVELSMPQRHLHYSDQLSDTSPLNVDGGVGGQSNILSNADQWDFLSFGTFFPGSTATSNANNGVTAPRTAVPANERSVVRIPQALLMRKLVDISVCLANGPGYRRDLIEDAILAAVSKRNVMVGNGLSGPW
jgi:hypothetical protein